MQKKFALSIQIDRETRIEVFLAYYKQATKKIFMPGCIYMFLLFLFLYWFVSDLTVLGTVMLAIRDTFIAQMTVFVVYQLGILYYKKNARGYQLQFDEHALLIHSKRSERVIPFSEVKTVLPGPLYDTIILKKGKKLITNIILVPLQSLQEEQVPLYETMIAHLKHPTKERTDKISFE